MTKPLKFLLFIVSALLLWIAFIWGKYALFYTAYSQEQINKIFEDESVPAPVYDSIRFDGYNFVYLTNKKNSILPNNSKKKPYLFLVHDSGHNSGYFLEYFKDERLNKLFHIIAPDRIGFGKTKLLPQDESNDYFRRATQIEFGTNQNYISSVLPREILDKERHHIDEIRMVYHGNAAFLALEAYKWEYLSFNKIMMFYPNMDKRNTLCGYYSKTISTSFLQHLFPRPYINKHKDLLYLDNVKENNLDDSIKFAQKNEDDENKEHVNKSDPFIESGKSKFVFFKVVDQSKKEEIEAIIDTKNHFEIEIIDNKSIYDSPEFVLDQILKADQYTKNYRKIK